MRGADAGSLEKGRGVVDSQTPRAVSGVACEEQGRNLGESDQEQNCGRAGAVRLK